MDRSQSALDHGEAKRQADFRDLLAGTTTGTWLRWRVPANTNVGLEEPASFVTDVAHAAIEAGADVVAGHGPHLTLGVEIYRDRPILYSLGNFIFQNDNVPVFPAEAYERFGLDDKATPTDFLDARTGNETRGFPASPEYWHGFAAACDFRGGKLARLELHPLDLGHGTSRAQRGRPVLAQGSVATAILDRVQRLVAKIWDGPDNRERCRDPVNILTSSVTRGLVPRVHNPARCVIDVRREGRLGLYRHQQAVRDTLYRCNERSFTSCLGASRKRCRGVHETLWPKTACSCRTVR